MGKLIVPRDDTNQNALLSWRNKIANRLRYILDNGSMTLVVAVSDTITVSGSMDQENTFYPVDATSAAVTLTLIDATANTGRIMIVKKMDSTTNAMTIDTTLSQTIDGLSSVTTNTQYDSWSFLSDGTNWNII